MAPSLILEDDVILASTFLEGFAMQLLNHPPSLVLRSSTLGAAGTSTRLRVYVFRGNGCGPEGALYGFLHPWGRYRETADPKLGIEWYWLEDPVVVQGSKNGTFRSAIQSAPPSGSEESTT